MKIEFIPNNAVETLLAPVPAVTMLPDWYKKMSPFIGQNQKQEAYADGNKNVTIKWCNPFGDALAAGYFILLENEIQVTQRDNKAYFIWHRGGKDVIENHNSEQFSKDLIPEGYETTGFKFKNLWGIKTPAGYSTIFSHPLNGYQTPFLTLSGLVETDTYNAPVNFPFLIQKNFDGTIPAGTPIAQVIPFKRENWKSEIAEFSPTRVEGIRATFDRHISRPYKRLHWKRKEYK